MVDAQHGEAVERDVADELVVAGGHRLGGAPMVQVLGIHVGDDGDGGGQAEEAAVALIGLDHHPVAFAQAGVGAVGVDDAAVDDGGVEMRRPSSTQAIRLVVVVLPWVPPTGDRPAQAHQLGQHLRPAHHGDQHGARGGHLGLSGFTAVLVTTTCAGAEIGRIMADGDTGCRPRAGAARWRCRLMSLPCTV